MFGEVEVLLDEVVFAIRLSTGNEWETEGGGGDTSLEVEEELSTGPDRLIDWSIGGTDPLMCLKTFCHMVA